MDFNTNPSISLPLIAVLLVLSSACNLVGVCKAEPEVEDESHFTYQRGSEGGPENWGLLNPDWKTCRAGRQQSPIDLISRRVWIESDLGKLKRDYRPAQAVVRNRGHDISVMWKGNAGKLKVNGTIYYLRQCHWHTPSEHTINGNRYNMELHIVHESADGKIAVIGNLYKYGRPDTFLKKLLHNINAIGDAHENTENRIGIVNPGNIKFGSRKYYRYIGSLTTPPCTEGVVWTISKKIRTVSREQVRTLRQAVHDVGSLVIGKILKPNWELSRSCLGFVVNSRPTQNLNSRRVSIYTPKVLEKP